MDEERRVESTEGRDEEEPEADLPASTLIGANITGANAGTFPGGVVAPAAEAAELEEARKEEKEGAELGAVNYDALSQFTPDQDQSVSTAQSEAEADELNG